VSAERERVRVELVDPEPNGLAEMLAGLLRANLARSPDRSRLVKAGVVQLDAPDAGIVVTVRSRPGRVEIANGPANPGAHLVIRASSRDLLELSATPLRLGLPDPLRRRGRAVLARVARRRVRISGMLRHPVLLSRFSRLLSVD
jgi:hypothetical protein